MIYIICFVNRSGSSHLCSLLAHAGLGVPQEYYLPTEFSARRVHWNVEDPDPANYLSSIAQKQGDVAGVKINWNHFQLLLQETDINKHDLRYIYLTRRDKIKQAISWVKAMQTGSWSCHSKPLHIPIYDSAAIDAQYNMILDQEFKWTQWLANKNHLKLEYEDITVDTVNMIADFLGVQTKTSPTSAFQIQRDDLNEEWERKYRAGL